MPLTRIGRETASPAANARFTCRPTPARWSKGASAATDGANCSTWRIEIEAAAAPSPEGLLAPLRRQLHQDRLLAPTVPAMRPGEELSQRHGHRFRRRLGAVSTLCQLQDLIEGRRGIGRIGLRHDRMMTRVSRNANNALRHPARI